MLKIVQWDTKQNAKDMLWIFGQDTKQNAKEMTTVLGDYKAEYKGNTNDLQESTKLNCKFAPDANLHHTLIHTHARTHTLGENLHART